MSIRPAPIRMMGLMSGIDTDMIVQQSTRAHQARIDTRVRSRTLLEWRLEEQRAIRQQIEDFQTRFLTAAGANGMLSRNRFNSTVASLTGNQQNHVTMRPSINSALGTMTINRVGSLARSTHVNGLTNISGTGAGLATTDRIGAAGLFDFERDRGEVGGVTVYRELHTGQANNNPTGEFTVGGTNVIFNQARNVTIGGNTYTVERDGADFHLRDAVGNIAHTAVGGVLTNFLASGVDYTFNMNGDALEVVRDDGGSITTANHRFDWARHDVSGAGTDYRDVQRVGHNLRVEDAGGTMQNVNFAFATHQITINGIDINLNRNMTVNEMMNAVNNSTAGVVMSYDRMADRFVIESAPGWDGGINNAALTITGLDSILGMSGAAPANYSHARVMINGEWHTFNRNTFTFRGVDITLNSVTEALDAAELANFPANSHLVGAGSAPPIIANFTRDATEAMNFIRDFVNAYNAIIERLERLTNERQTPRQRQYRPLTPEEMMNMSEREIEQWNNTARIGMLARDNSLTQFTSQMRRALFEITESAGLSPGIIGLGTGQWSPSGGTGGQIVIDEERLMAALEEDPERIFNMFANISEDRSDQGWIVRMREYTFNFLSAAGPSNRAIRELERSIADANTTIDRMMDRMWREEDRLFRQFAAMENAMVRMQQQGDWMSAMLGALN